MEHRWIGLGTAEFSEDQAAEWASLEGTTATPLLLHVTRVVCAICDQGFMDAAPDCPGMESSPRHHWVSLMTLAMTQEDAARWADPDDAEPPTIRPRSVGLACGLCGQPYDRADETCPEREFWH